MLTVPSGAAAATRSSRPRSHLSITDLGNVTSFRSSPADHSFSFLNIACYLVYHWYSQLPQQRSQLYQTVASLLVHVSSGNRVSARVRPVSLPEYRYSSRSVQPASSSGL